MLTLVAKSICLLFLGSCFLLLAKYSLISLADIPIIGSLELDAVPLATGWGAWVAGLEANGAGDSDVPLTGVGVGAGAEPPLAGFDSGVTMGDELLMDIPFFLK